MSLTTWSLFDGIPITANVPIKFPIFRKEMGKKQHQGTYVSSNEYAWSFGGKKAEKLHAAKGMGFRTVTHVLDVNIPV